MFPKPFARGVVGEQENIAFQDSQPLQPGEAGGDQLFSEPVAAMRPRDGQMMQVTAAAIVSGQHRADDFAVMTRDEAQPRIAFQITGDATAAVGFAEAQSFGLLPQAKNGRVIGDGHGFDFVTRRHRWLLS